MQNFDDLVKAVLANYHQRMEKEAALMQSLPLEEGMRRRDEFLLPVGQAVGQFLNTLTKGAGAQTILEIGTSYGYSTVWLAEAARSTGGKVISLEIDAAKVAYAQSQINQAGLSEQVVFHVGDAISTISALDQHFDLVLVDIWKDLYVPAFQAFYPKLNPQAMVIADNMLFPPQSKKAADSYRAAVQKTNAFNSMLLPIGSGIEISKRLDTPKAKS